MNFLRANRLSLRLGTLAYCRMRTRLDLLALKEFSRSATSPLHSLELLLVYLYIILVLAHGRVIVDPFSVYLKTLRPAYRFRVSPKHKRTGRFKFCRASFGKL